MDFWTTRPRPLIGLAPMDGMTDHPYRHIQKRYGNPDLIFTEFVRVERLAAGETRPLDRYAFLPIAREHARIFEESLAEWSGYSFRLMHKHLGWYVRGVAGARGLRGGLLRTTRAADVAQVLDNYLTYRARWEG